MGRNQADRTLLGSLNPARRMLGHPDVRIVVNRCRRRQQDERRLQPRRRS